MTSTKQIIEVTQAAGFHINEMMEHNEERGSFLRVVVAAVAGYPMACILIKRKKMMILKMFSMV